MIPTPNLSKSSFFNKEMKKGSEDKKNKKEVPWKWNEDMQGFF